MFATSDCPPFCSGLYEVGWAVNAAERALKHIATELGCAVVVYKTLKIHGNQPLSCHAVQDIPDDCPMYVDAKGALGLGQWGSTHISPTL